MAKYLVIVESPAKAKTIEKFLGKNYKVMASIGHVRDLPKSKMGIDIENNFEPQYITIRGKGPVIKDLRSQGKKAEKIFLATDPDREGEAIAWHLAHILGVDPTEKCRVTFHEITKTAVKEAIKNPKALDLDLVDAQQARRVLDRLVGYSISPMLWRKIRRGLSAGRVQSVATKLICDKEAEVEAFVPEEYWEIDAALYKEKKSNKLSVSLSTIDGAKKKIDNETGAMEITSDLEKNDFIVNKITQKTKSRSSGACFTTSSLQQEASSKLGFSTKKTMIVAQQLYEGISVKGNGTVGLITYMRTDSTRISNEAKESLNEFITENFSESYLKGEGKRKEKKSKGQQDAHEAIRPTSVLRTPIDLVNSLSKDQYKLYKLIWERFVASEMADAKFDALSIDIKNGIYGFKANGLKMSFDGFMKVYSFTTYKEVELPDLEVDDKLDVKKIDPSKHFTQPPARYTEATLVREMEEKGIGRPSTYAPTISTILSRGYVEKEKKALKPTELGILINDIMKNYFEKIVDAAFTANMEDEFDKVEEGTLAWKSVIEEFYTPFEDLLNHANEEMEKIDLTEKTDIVCDKCGEFMNIKYGRFGKFLACSNYPECDFTKAILNEIGIPCPKCEDGQVVERKTKKLKSFYGCSKFPNCDFVDWNKPVGEDCPKCGEYLVEQKTKKKHVIKCSSKECDYEKNVEDKEE